MKRTFLALSGCFLLLGSCKENDPIITYSSANYVDTNYVVSPIPTAAPHNVLVEFFTGQSCTNCPPAHATLDNITASNPGRVNVIGLYETGYDQADPPAGSYDLRSGTATMIVAAIYGGEQGEPLAGIDRIIQSGSSAITQFFSVSGVITTQLGIADSINLSVASSFNSGDSVASIVTTITYAQAVSTKQNLTIVLVEDSIKASQEYPTYTDTAYIFNDVCRGMVTKANIPYGDPILDTVANKPAGKVDKRTYTYTIPSTILNPAHCRIIAFLSNPVPGVGTNVIQSAQCPLE